MARWRRRWQRWPGCPTSQGWRQHVTCASPVRVGVYLAYLPRLGPVCRSCLHPGHETFQFIQTNIGHNHTVLHLYVLYMYP